jgi:hypothetical protein
MRNDRSWNPLCVPEPGSASKGSEIGKHEIRSHAQNFAHFARRYRDQQGSFGIRCAIGTGSYDVLLILRNSHALKPLPPHDFPLRTGSDLALDQGRSVTVGKRPPEKDAAVSRDPDMIAGSGTNRLGGSGFRIDAIDPATARVSPSSAIYRVREPNQRPEVA